MVTLCVDTFGIKYHSNEDLNHLQQTLKKYYEISLDKDGQNYCGLTLEWNYKESYVDVSMPHYITKALHKYKHPMLIRPQYAPHWWTQPAYGQKIQFALIQKQSSYSVRSCIHIINMYLKNNYV